MDFYDLQVELSDITCTCLALDLAITARALSPQEFRDG